MHPGCPALRLAMAGAISCGLAIADINLSPSTANVAAAGGTGSVQVINTVSTATWQAESTNTSWLTITSGATGTGNGTIQYQVVGNPSAASRTAGIIVTPSSGTAKTFTVTQLGGQLSFSPSSANVQGTGGSGTITISSSDPSLQWTATSNQTWLTITSGATGTGPGSIQWSAAANTTTSSRTGVITITPLDGTGGTFTVTQQAGTATGSISLSPSSINVDAAGSSGSVQVIATLQTLSWTAASNQSWLTITSGSSGTGNGTIQYTASANPSAASRTATLTVTPTGASAVSLTVTQSGGVLVVSPSSANVDASGGS